ncbi:MAG: TorF family putative porin [Sphingorhabdus sp.]
MRKSIFKLAAVCTAFGSISAAAPVFAQDAEEEAVEGPITISGGVTVVSDYRFRGVSLSDKDFAVQPTLTIKHESGLYAGIWGSNIAENTGKDVEVDLYAGFAGGEELTYDIGATYYLYPGVSSLNYLEVTGKLGSTIGPATVGVQLSYVPEQDNTGDQDNIYYGANATVALPDSPISIVGTVGIEDGAFTAGDEKVDWSLGLTANVSGFVLGASYVDTNRRSIFATEDSKAGVVFSLGYSF